MSSDKPPTNSSDADAGEVFDTSGVEYLPKGSLNPLKAEWPGMRSRWIFPPTKGGWSPFALGAWELEKAAWTDLHHHDEIAVVVEGELHVTVDGKTVIARPGDTVRAKAGHLGHYAAPEYARMIAIYGPNAGDADEAFGYQEL